MPLARYREQFWFANENLAVNVPAHVFSRFSNIHALLFADQAGTIPLTNPVNTDASGFLDFWVDDGDYWVFINGQAFGVIIDVDPAVTGAWPATFRWEQTVPSVSWVIYHGLNSFPNVDVLDPLNEELFGEVDYVDADNLTITFSTPTAGVAYLRR